MPELPGRAGAAFVDRYALTEYDAAQLTQSREVSDYFEAAVAAGASPKVAGNWIIEHCGIDALPSRTRLSRPARARRAGNVISGSIAKDVFETMFASGQDGGRYRRARKASHRLTTNRQIARLVAEVLAKNADAVAQYRGGKRTTFGFLVGQVMKAAGGKANPKRVNELLKRVLDMRSGRVVY